MGPDARIPFPIQPGLHRLTDLTQKEIPPSGIIRSRTDHHAEVGKARLIVDGLTAAQRPVQKEQPTNFPERQTIGKSDAGLPGDRHPTVGEVHGPGSFS